MSCSKTAKTYPAQLEILKSRGLLVSDEARALHCLEHHKLPLWSEPSAAEVSP